MGVLRDDQLAGGGYWGPVTSTLDWCELNYEHSQYIAEYWNTVSNLAMILPPMYSMIRCAQAGIERRFLLLYVFLMLVGFGSWWFHMTLLYEMQLLDELPMVWGTLIMVYCLVTVYYPKLDNSLALMLALFGYGIIHTTIYLMLKTPIIHQINYGLLTVYALYLDIQLCRQLPKCDRKLLITALALYYTGFMVWNVDNVFCDQLEHWRQTNSAFVRPLTQFHAWWHVLAGYGSFVHCAFCIHVRSVAQGRPISFRWSGPVLLPSTELSKSRNQKSRRD